MTSYDIQLTLGGDLGVLIGDDDVIEALLDDVMEHLLDCDVEDPTIGFSADANEIEIGLQLRADRTEDAVLHAMTVLRTSFHAAGAPTPGWEDAIDTLMKTARADAVNDRETNGLVSA